MIQPSGGKEFDDHRIRIMKLDYETHSALRWLRNPAARDGKLIAILMQATAARTALMTEIIKELKQSNT